MSQQTFLETASADPMVVELTRGGIVESRHAVDLAIVDAEGVVVASWGDVDRPVFPRSACKPLQALPVVETGAADAFSMSQKELSLCCASHNGEPIHVEGALSLLERMGLSDDDLECGAHPPRRPEIFSAFVERGDTLLQAHNNCSGKHSGMLSHTVHLGDQTKGYIEYDHPAQKRVRAALEEMYGVPLADAAWGRDGCSIPTLAVPTRAMAGAMAKFASPDGLGTDRANGCRRIRDAIMAEPYMIAGSGRCCSVVMSALPGKVVMKTGAEGVYMAGLPGKGLGIALKSQDGNGRAAETALLHTLNGLGLIDPSEKPALDAFLNPNLRNVNGFVIGEMRAIPWAKQASF